MISMLSGNGRALLTIDERGGWEQLFYPHPGLHQQLQHARLGLYDEDQDRFTWVDQEGPPPVEMTHLERTNICRSRLERMGLTLTVDNMVHPHLDMVIRRIQVNNPEDEDRKIRLFHYQNLHMAGPGYQETAYWDEERRSVTHYKRGYYFQLVGRPAFDHFTCGEHTLKGLEGSYVDAEDGTLEGNQISHGAADSVVQWDMEVPADGLGEAHLLMLIGGSRRDVNEFYRGIEGRPPDIYTSETQRYWRNWTSNREIGLADDLSETAREVYERSLFVLQDCQAANGSIIASPDSRTLKWGGDSYCYCWWRDGAIITQALSEVNLHRNTVAFLRFAAKAQEDEGYFLHRHFPDGSVGSTWHPPPFLQVDQTASVIEAARYFYECSGMVDELLPSWGLVRDAADFLMEFVDGQGLPRPSYDLWEEHKSVNTYTVATAIQGLRGAAEIGKALGKRSDFWDEASNRMHKVALDELWNPDKGAFYKSIQPTDDALDASVLLALQAGLLPPTHPRYEKIVDGIEDRLWVDGVGGIARYEGDQYYGHENPWIICTLWLARCRLALGQQERCLELIEWAASQAGPTRLLPEQLDRETGEPTSVTPLVWSHSTFIETLNAYTRALVDEPPTQQAGRTSV